MYLGGNGIMKKNIVKGIIIVAIIVVLFIPIFMEMQKNASFKTITYDDVDDIIKDTSSYKFTLIYAAPKSMQSLDGDKENIKNTLDKYKKDDKELSVYYLDTEKLNDKQINNLSIDKDTGITYIFAVNGETLKTVGGSLDSKKLKSLVKEYSSNGIDDDLVKYKKAENADEYLKKVKSKKNVTMAVFGRDNCYYCRQFMPVVNTVAEENNLDNIYYFDSNNYDENEYNKIMDSNLTIPAACSSTGKEAKLSDGFGTPLTLFTKKNKVIDCINGYVNKKTLISKLKTVGMIEDK